MRKYITDVGISKQDFKTAMKNVYEDKGKDCRNEYRDRESEQRNRNDF